MTAVLDVLDPAAVVLDGLAELEDAVDGLLSSCTDPRAISCLSDDDLLEGLRRVERVRRRLAAADVGLIRAVTQRELPQRHCQGTTRRFLAGLLQLSPAEAARRSQAADALGEGLGMTGETTPAERPVLADSVHRGAVSAEQTAIILTALDTVAGRGYPADEVDGAERLLTELAEQFAPTDLRRLAERVVEAIDPDGTVPDAELQAERRRLVMSQHPDGSWVGKFRLTAPVGAKLRTVLDALAGDRSCRLPGDVTAAEAEVRPAGDPSAGRQSSVDHHPSADYVSSDHHVSADHVASDHHVSADHVAADHHPLGVGSTGRPAAAPDEPDVWLTDTRSYPQRLHDALEDACNLLLRAGTLPAAGGIPATVVVTVSAESLAARTGLARLAAGGVVPVRDLVQLAGQADVVPVVCTAAGVPLAMGRTRRIATPRRPWP